MLEPDSLADQSLGGAGPHAGYGDQKRSEVAVPLPKFAREGMAAHSGHIDIRDHHVWPEKAACFKGLIATQ